jgi:hypothetical protein
MGKGRHLSPGALRAVVLEDVCNGDIVNQTAKHVRVGMSGPVTTHVHSWNKSRTNFDSMGARSGYNAKPSPDVDSACFMQTATAIHWLIERVPHMFSLSAEIRSQIYQGARKRPCPPPAQKK